MARMKGLDSNLLNLSLNETIRKPKCVGVSTTNLKVVPSVISFTRRSTGEEYDSFLDISSKNVNVTECYILFRSVMNL